MRCVELIFNTRGEGLKLKRTGFPAIRTRKEIQGKRTHSLLLHATLIRQIKTWG
jgi:hypothetical protein